MVTDKLPYFSIVVPQMQYHMSSAGVAGHGRLHSDWNLLMVMEDSCVVLLSSAAAGSLLLHIALKGTSLFNNEMYFQTILLLNHSSSSPLKTVLKSWPLV